MKMIYLDYQATTPIEPKVFEAMKPYLESHFGDSGSVHKIGQITRGAIEDGRETVASSLTALLKKLYFGKFLVEIEAYCNCTLG